MWTLANGSLSGRRLLTPLELVFDGRPGRLDESSDSRWTAETDAAPLNVVRLAGAHDVHAFGSAARSFGAGLRDSGARATKVLAARAAETVPEPVFGAVSLPFPPPVADLVADSGSERGEQSAIALRAFVP